MLAIDGYRGMVLSYSLNNIRDNLLQLYRDILAALELHEGIDYKIVRSPAINITIYNTPIMLRTASNPDKLRGPSIDYFMLDESREMERYALDIMLGRLRSGNYQQWFIGTTTRGKDWVYEILKENEMLSIFESHQRLLNSDNLTVIRTTIDEAPHLSRAYIEDLKRNYTSKFARQELYALIIESEGEVLSPEWLKIQRLNYPSRGVRYWDLAVSTKDAADNSCGCLMEKRGHKLNIINMKKVKLAYPDLKRLIIDTAKSDGEGVTIYVEESGQQKAIVDDLRSCFELHNHVIKGHRPTKDKITRCYPLASQAELGNLYVNDEPWVKDLKDELSMFNVENVAKGVGHDDLIDSMTGAYAVLAQDNTIKFARI